MTNIEILQKQISDLQARLEEVEYERDEWRKVAESKQATGLVEIAACQFGLTRTETLVLQSLWNNPICSLNSVHWDVYSGREVADLSNSIKVWMLRIRQKMGDPLAVLTIWGRGYRLSDTGRELIKKAAGGMQEKAA